MDIVIGNVDYTCYLGKGTKKWDTAAGEAILNSFGGKILSMDINIYLINIYIYIIILFFFLYRFKSQALQVLLVA